MVMVIILKQDVKIDSKFNLINLMLILKHDDYGHMSSIWIVGWWSDGIFSTTDLYGLSI